MRLKLAASAAAAVVLFLWIVGVFVFQHGNEPEQLQAVSDHGASLRISQVVPWGESHPNSAGPGLLDFLCPPLAMETNEKLAIDKDFARVQTLISASQHPTRCDEKNIMQWVGAFEGSFVRSCPVVLY